MQFGTRCYRATVEEAEQMRAGYFIDCKCSPTSVVGGGPAEDGANAARWDVEVNRAFYNGWKSGHGLKHQTGYTSICTSCITLLFIHIYIYLLRISTLRINFNGVNSRNSFLVDSAYGVAVDICGPTSLRRSDLHLLRDGAINGLLALLQHRIRY